MAGLTDADLERQCERQPAPSYTQQFRTVRTCLRIVMHEEAEYRRYAARDLATLESR